MNVDFVTGVSKDQVGSKNVEKNKSNMRLRLLNTENYCCVKSEVLREGNIVSVLEEVGTQGDPGGKYQIFGK